MSSLAGRVAMVTGGGRGIGAAVVQTLAGEGASVAVCDIERAAARAVAEAAGAEPRAIAIEVDVTDRASMVAAIDQIESGLGPIDVLVTVAALNLNERFIESDGAAWERVVKVNLFGTFIPCREVVPGMLERGRGRVITFGSDAGKVGSVGSAVYGATKGGIIAFTKTLAREVAARGVTVNCVCPGPTNTPMMTETLRENPKLGESLTKAIPMRRLAEPEDLAAMVAFLAGDGAAFITGQAISVSGGLTMN